MSTINLYSQDLSPEAWASLWGELPRQAFVLAEREDRVAITRCAHLDEPASWKRGHVFIPDWHIRWLHRGPVIRMVWIGEQEGPEWLLSTQPRACRLPVEETTQQRFRLWGRKHEGKDYWVQYGIPHLMRAPAYHPPGIEEPSGQTLQRYVCATMYRLSDTSLRMRFTEIVVQP